MDITTLVGILSLIALIVTGVLSGELASTFLNWHGLGIVLGGTFIAMMINTPLRHLIEAVWAIADLLRGERMTTGAPVMTATLSLAEQVHSRGVSAFQDADSKIAFGYLHRAAQTAAEYNNPDLVQQILENEINQTLDRQNEIVNVFRTMGVLAPMFGLLGTLIGIVRVLQEIANPAQVGAAMAIAVTTAFYGIALANVFCIPVAGKLRIRYMQESHAKAMIADGIIMMMRGTVPAVIERKLQSYF